VTTGTPPTSIIPKVNPSRGLQLLDIDAEELARQMTIFEADLYNRILPVDCLDKAWSRIDSPSHGAHIKAMILASNRIAGWVAHAVLSHVDPKRRAQIMKHFLHVANVSW
jgi:son of sevenless-like protein